jgi:serine phosphatase RsbU (regulator of sigma subunit)/HAMP domain-containing protein
MIIKNLGIKQKFVFLAVALLSAVALFILIFFPLRQQEQMSEYLTQKVFVISDMVSFSTTSGLLFDDLAGVQTYLNILKSLDEVEFVLVYKEKKKFADYREANSKLYQQSVAQLLRTDDRKSVDLEDVTIAAVPVMSDNEVIGRVVVGVTRQNLKTDVARSRMVAIIVGIAVLAVGSIVFFWQTTRIVNPLLSLERASRKVAEGEFEVAVTANTGDEVGVLANAFNVMVANIRSSIEEIRNKNTALMFQQELIEQINKRLTDSIQYAKRIQSSILPAAEVMEKSLPPHFFIFKPKDVVSGDFFWFSTVGSKSIIAVVDCTGHGVPGAFMSMIGNTLLNNIVNQRQLTDPAKILEALNIGVRLALKQDGDSALAKDGMDACICVLEGQTIYFAGANRPLFVAYNREVTRLRGDSASIGGGKRQAGASFTTHIIEAKPSMAIYLTTDGYIDQSNPDGIKLGTRKFQEMIAEHYMLDVHQQRSIFVKALHEHQGSEDQRDDITLVGIRFP